MRDKEEGYIEIELQGGVGQPNHVIRRDLSRANNK